ncbi:putative helicase mov-10-B.1 isoform X2 [Varroa destructor]|uniref:RNA helicase n=1 Tax=Varroa destructor TaxID=109461 RepID=A0A7M7KAT4_VARDE|nr:putative helicase mov-10-B.1 isoform X2 [Varroa destructor]
MFVQFCWQGFGSAEEKTAHKQCRSHNLQYLKINYAQRRDELGRDKYGVTISADPERFETKNTGRVSGHLVVHLVASVSYGVRILSCDPLIRLEGVEIWHPALDNDEGIRISPGQTVRIQVNFTTYIPIEISVPIGLKMCFDGQRFFFNIVREITFFSSCEDFSSKAMMGDHDYEAEFHIKGFKTPEKLYKSPVMKTKSIVELPLPIAEEYEIPKKWQLLQKYLNDFRRRGEPQVMDQFAMACFTEIKNLLKAPLNEESYITKLQVMLYLEEMAKKAQLMSQNLASIKIFRNTAKEYEVYLPGLSEKRPPIRVGFQVNVRELVDSTIVYQGAFTSIGDSTARFCINSKFDKVFRPSHKYSLEFQLCRHMFTIMHNSLTGVKDKVVAKSASCLFPKREFLKLNSPLMNDRAINEMTLYNKEIKENPEQFKAIKSIIKGEHRPAPFILFGPPGTGKTSTIVEAIMQIVMHQASTRILVCASSNSACDVICDKILKHINPGHIYRLYSASFEQNKISSDIQAKRCHNYVSGIAHFPAEETLQQYRVISATLATTWRFQRLPKRFFSHIFIDECGFAMEPEALIPIYTALGTWTDECQWKPACHLILAGDIQQLGPVLASSMTDKYLSISFMERLMNDPDYPYQKPYDENYIVKLRRNYRSHESILKIPNELFYDNELQECANKMTSHKFIHWEHLINKEVPLIFHNCVSEERRDRYSTSYFNLLEAETVLNYVNTVLTKKDVRESDIGVITPYAAQVKRIRHLLLLKKFENIKVGTVEEFQGQERLVIIVSAVRNCKDLLQQDLLRKLGFLKNPKRFNVALTRAKALFICIGNASILEHDVCWTKFIRYVESHKAWAGVPPQN